MKNHQIFCNLLHIFSYIRDKYHLNYLENDIVRVVLINTTSSIGWCYLHYTPDLVDKAFAMLVKSINYFKYVVSYTTRRFDDGALVVYCYYNVVYSLNFLVKLPLRYRLLFLWSLMKVC